LIESLTQAGMLEVCLSVGVACAAGFAAWAVISIYGQEPPLPEDASSFEFERRSILESSDYVYANLEVLVQDLAKINQMFIDGGTLERIRKSLLVSGDAAPWLPAEFVAVKQIEGAAAGLFIGGITLAVVSIPVAAGIGLGIAAMYVYIMLTALHDNARRRLQSIKMRLPFVVDLIALVIEAGATFQESLATAAHENRNHPISAELARLNRQIELQIVPREALEGFRDRFEDPDIAEIVFAINKGNELGTPLATTLRNQADQMRLKRSQWGEKAAAEAQVKMSFPGMIVMLACSLVVLAPIVLPAIMQFLNSNFSP